MFPSFLQTISKIIHKFSKREGDGGGMVGPNMNTIFLFNLQKISKILFKNENKAILLDLPNKLKDFPVFSKVGLWGWDGGPECNNIYFSREGGGGGMVHPLT